ncbi:Uncharacterised protein [Candidatus Norongarragalina meridionalis]|nr:Uncharacterised protein [Candidatus Norongarragalina meridionalis]
MKGEKKLFAVGAAALVLLLLVGFAFLQKQQPQSMKVNWNMGEAYAAQSDAPSSVEVTAYQATQSYWYFNSGLGLVKERRSVPLTQGTNSISLQGVAQQIDATSIHVADLTDANAQALEQNYQYDLVSQYALLEKYVGKQIYVTANNRTIMGTLLSTADGLVLQTSNGIIALRDYSQVEFPSLPEGLLTKPTISLLLGTQKPGTHDIELSYLTHGITWEADYVAIANPDDTLMDLQGWVSVQNNAGATFKDAKLKLVAGDIHMAENNAPTYYDNMLKSTRSYSEGAGAAPMAVSTPQPQFSTQNVFEYNLYTLERPTTLNDQETKQIELMNAHSIPVEKQYVYQPSQSSSIQTKLVFKNSGDGLGVALPAGKVRVMKPDSDGQLQFLGEDMISHTPKEGEIRLFVGNAMDITAEKTTTNQRQMGSCSDEYTYTVKLTNRKDSAVTVKYVEDSLWGTWEIRSETLKHEKKDAHTASWMISVPANGVATLDYTVFQTWC